MVNLIVFAKRKCDIMTFETARIVPFVVGVVTDADEVTNGNTMTDSGTNGNEQFVDPGGIIGFHLTYTQTC